MDASVSMRGFVTVSNSAFNRDVPIILSDLRSNLNKKTGENYYMVVDWDSSTIPQSIKYDQFVHQIIEPTGMNYKGQTTQVYSIIHQIASELKKGDVGVFITDGVLSEGFEKITRTKSDNSKYFGDLQREVKEALDAVYDSDLSYAIVRATANYDGRFYCACDERAVPAFRDSIMKKRPYYFIILGQDEVMSTVLDLFTFKNEMEFKSSVFRRRSTEIVYSLAQTYCAGLNGIEYQQKSNFSQDSSKLCIHLNLNGFDNDNTPEVFLCIPTIESARLERLDSLVMNGSSDFFTVSQIPKSKCIEEVEKYSKPTTDYWNNVGLCYKLKFNNSDTIKSSLNNHECKLSFLLENPLKDDSYNIDYDIDKSLQELEGRTFGFKKFMEAISWSKFKQNMEDGKSVISTININIIID